MLRIGCRPVASTHAKSSAPIQITERRLRLSVSDINHLASIGRRTSTRQVL
jgi:hypothetical protein